MFNFCERLTEAVERQYRVFEPYRTLCEIERSSSFLNDVYVRKQRAAQNAAATDADVECAD